MPAFTPTSSRPSRSASPGSPALRVAAPRQTRQPTLVALALLLVLAGGTAGALLYLRATQDNQVLAVARPVSVGQTITDADLVELSLSIDPRLRPLPASARREIVGQVAAVNLVPGTLLLRTMVTGRSLVGQGQGLVGLAVKASQAPEQLKPGDVVQVVRTPPASGPSGADQGPADLESAGTVLASRAQVLSATSVDGGETTRVSLLVPLPAASALYRANATGQVALVVVAPQ